VGIRTVSWQALRLLSASRQVAANLPQGELQFNISADVAQARFILD
jgi:hypothetical protein